MPCRDSTEPAEVRRGFTLVELVVVVGIIAVLVALLMPAMTNARRQAVRVKCAAHLAQVGHAVAMYAAEHKGAIPVAYSYPVVGWPLGYHWPDHLAPYLQQHLKPGSVGAVRDNSVVWGCPAWDSRWVDPMPQEYWGRAWKTGYGYNCRPCEPDPSDNPYDIMLINHEAGGFGRYFKLSEIRHPSLRGLVTDAIEVYVSVGYPWNPSVPIERQQFGLISPTRHGRWGSVSGVNALFFDGHVESLSAREVYYAFHDPMRTEVP